MNFRVDQEASCVSCFALFSCQHHAFPSSDSQVGRYLVPSDYLSRVDVQAYQITSSHKAEVFSKWVHPDVVFVLWIAYRNMARDTFCEAFASKVAKYCGGMDEDVFSLFGMT